MKKVLFALPALAFTLFLAFCQKSETQEVDQLAGQNAGVIDRGNCYISWLSNAPVIFCGTNTNTTICNSRCATYPNGVVTSGPFNVPAGTILWVTTTSPTGASLYINGSGPIFVPAAGICLKINDDCSVTVI